MSTQLEPLEGFSIASGRRIHRFNYTWDGKLEVSLLSSDQLQLFAQVVNLAIIWLAV
jgi:hypothetical protein